LYFLLQDRLKFFEFKILHKKQNKKKHEFKNYIFNHNYKTAMGVSEKVSSLSERFDGLGGFSYIMTFQEY